MKNSRESHRRRCIMNQLNNSEKYSVIAAICFFALGVLRIIDNLFYTIFINSSKPTVWAILSLGIIVAFSVFLYLGKINIGFMVVAGIYALLVIEKVILYISLYYVIQCSARILIFVAILLAINKSLELKSICFVSAPLLLFATICFWIEQNYFGKFDIVWLSMLQQLMEIVGLLFIGFWLNEEAKTFPFAPNTYTFAKQQLPNSNAASSVIGGADKLKTFKELLDSGTITQEEFDAKKKEILNL